MEKRKIIIFVLGFVGISLMFGSFFLFITREVGGFDIFNSDINGCTAYSVFITKGEVEYSVEVNWLTKDKCVGYVNYGKDASVLDLVVVDLLNEVNTKEHTVVLEKLLTTKRYFIAINSDDTVYGIEGIPLEFRIADL